MKKSILFCIILFVLNSCATYNLQVADDLKEQALSKEKEIEHSFYLIGNTFDPNQSKYPDLLEKLNNLLKEAPEESTLLFLGNSAIDKNTIDKGYLKNQIEALKNFKGNTIFIPGEMEWKKDVENLEDIEDEINDKLGKNTFLPENGCPIEDIDISDSIKMIVVDSQWFLNDWNAYPNINDNCDIKTKELFFDEFESLVKKAENKTVIVAMHHPLYTVGEYGGQYSAVSHLTPLPLIGTLKNVVRKTSGILSKDIQYPRYRELKERLSTLAQENDKVIFVSSHEKNLQYLIQDNLRQIISGSATEVSRARLTGGAQFTYAKEGLAKLTVYKDGSSNVTFSSLDNAEVYFENQVFDKKQVDTSKIYPVDFPKTVKASIYTKEETEKKGFYKVLWGERYRDEYSQKVEAPTVRLDTLFGGLIPIKRGGGNQSKSLRLEDKNGAQYVMRALRKNGVRYLQAVMFKDQFIEGQFDDTFTEDLILDVFTGAHPYAPFVIGDLADAAGVYHTNPVLYYVPKQNALGRFNDDYGDELYMIEEHTSEGHSDIASFGFQDKLDSTDKMLERISKDEDIIIDEANYIRARLFDMVIGDWDRHEDQWRWIEFKENGQKVYRALPRDRDQAFSIMDDGFLLGTATTLLQSVRMLNSYTEDLKDVKGVNIEPFPLDLRLIQQSDKSVWDAQVKQIQEGLSDEIIEKAILNFPKELNIDYTAEIRRLLVNRVNNLQKISDRYFKLINKYPIIVGTNKDDWFDIERLANGKTKVTAYRIKGGEKADIFHQRTYNPEEASEIWIYALDDKDVFNVSGDFKAKIKVRLVGGQNNDTYDIQNGSRLKFYDYKNRKNTIVTDKGSKRLTDDYDTNVYDYKKPKADINQIIPVLAINPDDGLKIGVQNTYTHYGFERNPYTQKHHIDAAYFFATGGYELNYSSEFANTLGNANLGIDLKFNSPNYAFNFFGFGNSTPNFESDEDDGIDVDLDYNRVKIRTFQAMPSVIWKGELGSIFKISAIYESNEVERTEGRFLDDAITINEELNRLSVDESIFDKQDFYGAEVLYDFENKDSEAFPTLGMQLSVIAGYKNNVSRSNGFGYLISELGFDYKLISSGILVLATDLNTHVNFGDGFEFYQGATIGADNGLRGYRFNRFNGKSAFVQSTDLRWNFSNVQTNVLPIHMGIFGGFDYGKVWVDDQLVFENSYNSKSLNTSFGGGFFINMADVLSVNISAFSSDDDLRLAFQFGFSF